MHLKGLVKHFQKMVLFIMLWLNVLEISVFEISVWVNIFFDILIAHISCTVAQTPINYNRVAWQLSSSWLYYYLFQPDSFVLKYGWTQGFPLCWKVCSIIAYVCYAFMNKLSQGYNMQKIISFLPSLSPTLFSSQIGCHFCRRNFLNNIRGKKTKLSNILRKKSL